MNTEQAMAAAHERLTEIIKNKRIPRKLKKKNKKKGLLNPDIHRKAFSLLYPKDDYRKMLSFLTDNSKNELKKCFYDEITFGQSFCKVSDLGIQRVDPLSEEAKDLIDKIENLSNFE